MSLLKVVGIVFGAIVLLFGFLLFLIVYGEPIHDLNTWRLEKNFYAKNIAHPEDSVLVKKIRYLGGISTHGDMWCVYAVGEWRSSPLSREKIIDRYHNETTTLWGEKVSIKVMFSDGYEGPHTLPYTYWQDDLRDTIADKDVHYIVYASTQWPIILYDDRCDD